MIEIDRETFKTDPVFQVIYQLVKENHQVASHTKKNLYENRHIKDFCEEARHYIMIPGRDQTFYIHYDVASWYHPKGAQIKIEKIVFYDDFIEYEAARIKGLHSTKDSDGANLN